MRKKLFTKIAVIVLSIMLCLPAVACGEKNNEVAGQTLNIYLLEQGYGRDWLTNTIASFKEQSWVKEKYPQLEIKTTINDDITFASSQMGLEKKNKYDILFGSLLNGYYGSDRLVNLTEKVYNAKIPGENVTYGEKLNESSKGAFAYYDMNSATGEPEYYAVPYFGGMTGFIYNVEALASYNLEVPRTTDEFYRVAVTIRDANKAKYANNDASAQYVFQQSNDAPYWQKHGLETWWVQYEGVDAYDDFYNGIVNDQRSVDIFKQKGRLESLKIFEKLLNYDEQFVNPSSFNEKFMPAQTAFMQGSAVFHFNGDWFTDEMKEIKQSLVSAGKTIPTLKMMKTPIISSIVEKCTTITGENGGTADAELSALVKAIDAGSTSLSGEGYNVNQKDFDKVYEARRIVVSTNSGADSLASAVIPSVSDAQDLAVDFLLFMASDEGIKQYCKGASGATIDFTFNLKESAPELYESLEPLHRDRIEYMLNSVNPAIVLKDRTGYPLSVYGNVKPFIDTQYYGVFVAKGNKVTAQDFYDNTIKQWTPAAWEKALQAAGLAV